MRFKFMSISILTILFVLSATASYAVTYMVSSDAELLAATTAVVNGDEVILASGQYQLSAQFDNLIILRGESGDPQDVVIGANDSEVSLFDVSGSPEGIPLVIEGITFSGYSNYDSLIDLFSGSAEIRNCIFEGIGSGSNGGVIGGRLASLTIEDSIFRYNGTAHISGGAIFLADGDLTVSGCVFSENHSNGYGGAIGLETSQLTMADCQFIGNTSINRGGGMMLQGVTGVIIDSTFEGNSGMVGGGGLSLMDASSLEMSGCIVSGNGSIIQGGGIQISGASYGAFSYCQIMDNDLHEHSDGVVYEYSSALFHCCEMDLEYWTLTGSVEFDNEGCSVATQQESFDSLKAMYR